MAATDGPKAVLLALARGRMMTSALGARLADQVYVTISVHSLLQAVIESTHLYCSADV